MTEQEQLVVELVQAFWPAESNLVGDEMLETIVTDSSYVDQVSSGEQADLGSIISTLSEAAVLVLTVMQIIQMLRQSRGALPSVPEVDAELRQRVLAWRNATAELSEAIIKEVLARMYR